jgi:hypothetical protein
MHATFILPSKQKCIRHRQWQDENRRHLHFFFTATARRYFFFAIFSKRLIDGQLPMFMIGRTTPAAL